VVENYVDPTSGARVGSSITILSLSGGICSVQLDVALRSGFVLGGLVARKQIQVKKISAVG